MYHFESRITPCNEYCISRDVSCAATITIIEGPVVRLDRCMDRYVPQGPRLRHSGCVSLRQTCITILDIASHDNTDFIIDELELVVC